MAHNKVTIDVEARFIDNVTSQAKKTDKAIDDLEKRKPKVVVDADTSDANSKLDKTGKKADELGKKNPKPKVDLEDGASKGLDKILDKTKALADKVCSVAVKIRDNNALAELSKIDEKAKSIAGKTWTAVVRVKDMALAPLQKIRQQLFSIKTLAAGIIGGMAANKYVIQPTLDYANKEDLVTQFAVMLKGKSDKPNYDAASARIDELTKFAGETPFTRDEIYQASRVLQTYTQGALATPDATGGLRMIGDIAAATGQEYTRVATYMGRLYNEVGRGGKSLGEPLMMLREIGALSAEQEEKITEIAQGSGTIEERWAKIAGQFKSTEGMMLEMSNQMNNLLLGVKSFFRNNLYMKLGEGISQSLKPFLIDFRKWRNENSDLIASWAEQIKDFAADASEKVLGVVRRTASRANKIMQSEEFQNADLFGKIGMLWEGAIKNPFAEWWSNTVAPWWDRTAVPWMTEKAARLGNTIGTGLSNGLLTLLGVDVTETAEQGASIAGSFVQGFLDGFDGSAITDALVGAISDIWGALPAWAKILVGGIGIAKGAGMISSIAGGVAGAAGGISSFLGGAASGTGLLGAGTTAAIGMGAGNLAGGASMSAGALSALGLGAIAGGAVGGVTAISGAYDIYKGLKEDDYTKRKAGAAKLGGVGAGAAAGAAIGSLFGGVGAVPGALIGAGLGGLAGIFGSNSIKKNAAENAKSIEELNSQMDSNSKASEVMASKQEALAESLGDVKLTYAEIQEVASNILTGSMADSMKAYTTATVNANKALQTFEGTTEELNKLNWKASVGFKFDDEGKDTYLKAVEDYIASAESVVENKHYEFTAAVSMLIDPKGENGQSIINGGDAFYASLQKQLDSTETELTKQVKIALEDGEITADEGAIIEKLQGKIAEITNKVAEAETEAKMEALKIKFGAGAIDSESFAQLQEELAAQLESSTLRYDDALTTSITGLKLQLDEGAIDQEAYDEQIKALTEGYEANIGELHAKAENLQLEILGDSYQDILGEDAKAKLTSALESSLAEGIAPMNWTAEQASTFLNTEGLTTQMASGIGMALQSVAETSQLDISPTKVTGEDKLQETVRTKGETATNNAFADPISTTATINADATVNWNILNPKPNLNTNISAGGGFRGGLFGPAGIRQFSNGGMVAGGAQLITVAEEGSPEMIIPMSSQRRGRALKLWAQAGRMLDVPGFARGGIVGGSGDEGLRYRAEEGSAGATAETSGMQINVGGVTVEVNVQGGGDANIAQAIATQSGEIADQIAGILADAFSAQFENTPTKGVA